MRECRSYACAARIGAGGRCAELKAPVWWSCDRKAGARIPSARQELPHADVALGRAWAGDFFWLSRVTAQLFTHHQIFLENHRKIIHNGVSRIQGPHIDRSRLWYVGLRTDMRGTPLPCTFTRSHLETVCMLKASARKLEHDWICMLTV
jgi:hypothetical protein